MTEKVVKIIEKMLLEKGARVTAMKMVDLCLKQLIGVTASDLADSSTYANGLDEIEFHLRDGDYITAFKTAKQIATEMVSEEDSEAGGMMKSISDFMNNNTSLNEINNINSLRLLIREMVNELTPNQASTVLGKRYSDHRAGRISKEAVKMVFREYIGKHLPLFMKIRNEDRPHKYQLIDVRWYDNLNGKDGHVIKFDFHSDEVQTGVGRDSMYPQEKQQFTISYSVNKDEIFADQESDSMAYFYNRAFINLIITVLNLSKKIYNKEINSKVDSYAKVTLSLPNNQIIQKGEKIPDEYKERYYQYADSKTNELPVLPTRYKVGSFRMFDYSSDNLKYAQINENKKTNNIKTIKEGIDYLNIEFDIKRFLIL